MTARLILIIIGLTLGLITLFSSAYVVHETEQVIITQFGEPMGNPVKDAGLYFKKPFIQEVNRIEKRYLPWDGPATEMSTKDKTYLIIDTFARWKISDPMIYFQRFRDVRRAQSRLDDILGSATLNAVAKHELIELVRTTKDRKPVRDESLTEIASNIGIFKPIQIGRDKIIDQIKEEASDELDGWGIELLDLRFKRVNYNETVRRRIYERMVSERRQIADRFRSEGAGEAAKIIGKKERDLQEIESEAYKSVQEIRGKADANATAIYAEAYDATPEAAEFYTFLKTLETYSKILDHQVSLIMTTDSPLFRLLKNLETAAEDPLP
ncbi:MAG: HflC protein [Opitutae bacterium]|nr:HflC protein [Opitutae bacterium]|tara:strand:+ start:174 stop:1148 length:975 start_codon:yes stop_codon:yes gene_type:complete